MATAISTLAASIDHGFSPRDLESLHAIGKRPVDAAAELGVLRVGTKPLELLRPCAPGDGVLQLSALERKRAADRFSREAWRRQVSKFVVAAGSASRMFQIFDGADESARRRLCQKLPELALYPALERAMRRRGLDALHLAVEGEWRPIADGILNSEGLGLASAPKGLIPFHDYPDGARTALEEHVAESLAYCAGYGNRVHVHAVVSAEHALAVTEHLELAAQRFRNANLHIKTDVSVQSDSTRTLALDAQGELLREDDGSLTLRPAGHGAALENLAALNGDLVFIRTVDNVLPEPFHATVSFHKQVLGGILLELEASIHGSLRALAEAGASQEVIDDAAELLQRRLAVALPGDWRERSPESRRRFLFARLNRPLRVCAVVPNGGHAGGGPFWIRSPHGQALRIIDKPEVKLSDEQTRRAWESAPYFNPADLVCSMRDFQGQPFQLSEYQARDEWYVLERQRNGRPVRLLERSGLWNGAMAEWNTVFVETPAEIFRPVKTILELLELPAAIGA